MFTDSKRALIVFLVYSLLICVAVAAIEPYSAAERDEEGATDGSGTLSPAYPTLPFTSSFVIRTWMSGTDPDQQRIVRDMMAGAE